MLTIILITIAYLHLHLYISHSCYFSSLFILHSYSLSDITFCFILHPLPIMSMEANPALDQCLDIDNVGLFSENFDHNLLCPYSYSDSVVLNESSLNIVQWNVRGLFGKQDQVVRLLRLLGGPNKVHVVCLNETWLRTETSSKVENPGYNIIHKCRVGKKGGGLSILVSNNCTFREIELTTMTHKNIEIMAIEIKCRNTNLLVGNVY